MYKYLCIIVIVLILIIMTRFTIEKFTVLKNTSDKLVTYGDYANFNFLFNLNDLQHYDNTYFEMLDTYNHFDKYNIPNKKYEIDNNNNNNNNKGIKIRNAPIAYNE